MLERTGASLKSCTLQRVLPKPAPTTKRCHKLHTGFWQHGALAIEMATIWHTQARRASEPHHFMSRPTDPASPSPHTGLVASAFLLDFLYPSATRILLQRLYPGLLGTRDSKQHSGAAPRRRRFATSPSTAVEPGLPTHAAFHDASESGNTRRLERPMRAHMGRSHAAQVPEASYQEAVHDFIESTAASGRLQASDGRLVDELSHLLSRRDEEHHQEVWEAYCRLGRDEQPRFRRDVVLYLSKSHGIVEAGRAASLFRQAPTEDWDNDYLAAGILAMMRSGDVQHAMDRLRVGLEARGLTGGLEYVLADAMTRRNWPLLVEVWLQFHASRLKFEPDSRPDDISLERLESVPSLDSVYFSFEQYLARDGLRSVRAINQRETSRAGLAALRRKLAQLAVMQPCQPKQAATILEMSGDHGLYHDYLLRVLERWQESELKSSVTWLWEIYKRYAEMPDARPSVALLRGMFSLFYPGHVAGIEQVYRDWHTTWGGLDEWGYEKFLKFYAARGDVRAVRELWKRYVAQFPRVVRKARAFRSTMNAYAQAGDAAGAETELRVMTERYGVQPDLDTWNTLLKCYVKRNDYGRTVACFEEICSMYRADSFTYAHVMAMAAKKGDVEATLGFFGRSQRDRIPVSREMAMSLVLAYCRNDRLLDAERIVMELAERKATSTAVWNQLIHFNGMQGRLNKCYALLQAMKGYDIAWDHQTHEFLLQALVRVNQVQPAYRLLRSACREKIFPVGPEHFAIVMAGAVRTGQHGLVEMLASQLDRTGQGRNLEAQRALADATFRTAPSSQRARELGRELVGHLRTLSLSSVGDVRYLTRQTRGVGRAVRLLVQLRDFTSAEELVNLHAGLLRHVPGAEPFPPDVVSALMLGYLEDRKYRQVHKLWARTWESVVARSRRVGSRTSSADGGGIYPAHHYDLSRPLSVVARAFAEQRNGKGLVECVRQVVAAGFRLTRSNWNAVVQHLARLGQWEPAMEWCETMLMPRWRGWAGGRRSLDERRQLMANARLLQASKGAVMGLQHHWLRLRALAAWSPAVSGKLAEVERRYPRLHHAFITAGCEDLARGLGAGKSLTGGAKRLLRPLGHGELRGMERVLARRGRKERRSRMRRQRQTLRGGGQLRML